MTAPVAWLFATSSRGLPGLYKDLRCRRPLLIDTNFMQPVQRGLWPDAYFFVGSQAIAVTTVRIQQELVRHFGRVERRMIELASRHVVLVVFSADDKRRRYLRFQVQIRGHLTVLVQISRINQHDEIGPATFPIHAINGGVSTLGEQRAGFRPKIPSGRESHDS